MREPAEGGSGGESATRGGAGIPAVSVIVATFNSSRTLGAAIESVLRQDLAELEVLVAGDGCTDDSAAVVTSFADPRVRWSNLPSNSGGPCRPRNDALTRARGRLIAYLGHDDLWLPWHLSLLCAAIEQSGAALVSSLGVYLEPRGPSTAFGFPERSRTSAPLSPSTWLHRADLDLRWPEHLRWGHEVFVADRLLARGVACRQVGEVTAIKFPAPSWRAYAPDAPLPQIAALAAIAEDARAFQGRLLSQLAVAVSGALVLSDRSRFPLLARAAFATAVAWLRPYRWPLDRLLQRRHRRASGLVPQRSGGRGPGVRESTGT
jgi:glycosyltransferase involved in cell wall biosynthesis